MFFSNLRRALTTGYFIEEEPATGELATVAVPGYVYLPDRGGATSQPIGFGLFKTIPEGYELWLTGVDPLGGATATAGPCWARCSPRRPAARRSGPGAAFRPRQPGDGASSGILR